MAGTTQDAKLLDYSNGVTDAPKQAETQAGGVSAVEEAAVGRMVGELRGLDESVVEGTREEVMEVAGEEVDGDEGEADGAQNGAVHDTARPNAGTSNAPLKKYLLIPYMSIFSLFFPFPSFLFHIP